jgi:hypothetical protein
MNADAATGRETGDRLDEDNNEEGETLKGGTVAGGSYTNINAVVWKRDDG